MDVVTKVRTPLFPTYRQAQAFMKATSGLSTQLVRDMITVIHNQRGTPQQQVDWTNPDEWISERLSGEFAELALRIWQTDNGILNPRHCYGSWMFINNFALMEGDKWAPSDAGTQFLADDAAIVRHIDDAEGILALLDILATKEQAKRSDILPDWQAFLQENSKFTAESSSKTTLYQRLVNVIDRGLVEKDGNSYQISDNGMNWLNAIANNQASVSDPRSDILRAAKQFNAEQKACLKQSLLTMDPYDFEHLIGILLEAMGYDEVEVTKASGDKGVDVKGSVQVGITRITEVIQAKRHAGTIGRPVIDQLRGALPYHKAIRGTIITTGKFADKCEDSAMFPGAAPITLIDGERLIELLVEHGIGIHKRKIELLELDIAGLSREV